MPCHFPKAGYRTVYAQRFDQAGRPIKEDPMAGPVVFSEASAQRKGLEIVSAQPIPCGRCQGCLSAQACDRTQRLIHEGQLWKRNCVVTLTYDQEHLPPGGTLVKKDMQDFMMRLRNHARRDAGQARDVRFEGIGEYGSRTYRAHYHVILFNWDFDDKLHLKGEDEREQFSSATLLQIWGKGGAQVGKFHAGSAAYVAGYLTQKRVGDPTHEQYARRRPDGSKYFVLPEFRLCSMRPGIGARWLDKFEADVFPHGYVVTRSGSKVRPPPYYEQRYRKSHPEEWHRLAQRRELEAIERADDNTPQRLAVKEEVLKARLAQLRRDAI